MNEALNKLYDSKWGDYTKAVDSIYSDESLQKPSNPLLLRIGNEEGMEKSDIRLMIFGQETFGWYDKEYGRCETVSDVQDLYDEFFNNEEYQERGGTFFKGVEKIRKALNDKFPDKKIDFVWNNILKTGVIETSGTPQQHIIELQRKHLLVIPQEIEILKPDIVIFFTGPNYDTFIKDNFGEVKYEALPDFEDRELSRLTIPGIKFSYRTYHPNYLLRNDIDYYIETIVNDINF